MKCLKCRLGEPEYLIEFKLNENGDSNAVQTAYIEAGLPANGPTVGGQFFMIFNAMSDTAVAMVIILISVLLIIIASLCIRLTFLATIDEDLREIGVMKAIGISKKDIKKVYLNKYRVMSVAAGIIGYLLSFAVGKSVEREYETLPIFGFIRKLKIWTISYSSNICIFHDCDVLQESTEKNR